MGKGIGRGPRKSTFHLQAARNENRPYDEEHNKYLLASFLGKDIHEEFLRPNLGR